MVFVTSYCSGSKLRTGARQRLKRGRNICREARKHLPPPPSNTRTLLLLLVVVSADPETSPGFLLWVLNLVLVEPPGCRARKTRFLHEHWITQGPPP